MNERASERGCRIKTLGRALCAAAVAVGVVTSGGRAAAGDAAPASTGAAMRLHRDPDTGAISGGPSPRTLADAAALGAERARANAAAELTEEPVGGPAGGVKVKLHGRYHPAETRRVIGPQPGAPSGTAGHE
jgi:hypothetical protein